MVGLSHLVKSDPNPNHRVPLLGFSAFGDQMASLAPRCASFTGAPRRFVHLWVARSPLPVAWCLSLSQGSNFREDFWNDPAKPNASPFTGGRPVNSIREAFIPMEILRDEMVTLPNPNHGNGIHTLAPV